MMVGLEGAARLLIGFNMIVGLGGAAWKLGLVSTGLGMKVFFPQPMPVLKDLTISFGS